MKLRWLGQSGFLLSDENNSLACDLYLSDYCQKKSRLDHTRLMDIPVEPDKLEVDHYIITHGHIDHFDPETIGPVLKSNNKTLFYCPPACSDLVREHFPDDAKRFIYLNTFVSYPLGTFRIIPIPAAHESLAKDDTGEYRDFSYIVVHDESRTAVLFGGDTIPYDGQVMNVVEYVPDGYKLILVIPVNGRDVERSVLGFKGNFTIKEAIVFYKNVGADIVVPCHFGMFALNDIGNVNELQKFEASGCRCIIPEVNVNIEI